MAWMTGWVSTPLKPNWVEIRCFKSLVLPVKSPRFLVPIHSFAGWILLFVLQYAVLQVGADSQFCWWSQVHNYCWLQNPHLLLVSNSPFLLMTSSWSFWTIPWFCWCPLLSTKLTQTPNSDQFRWTFPNPYFTGSMLIDWRVLSICFISQKRTLFTPAGHAQSPVRTAWVPPPWSARRLWGQPVFGEGETGAGLIILGKLYGHIWLFYDVLFPNIPQKGKNLNKGNKRPETHETDPKYRDGPQN